MERELLEQHTAVFDEATQLYVVRTDSYGEVWRNYGAMANLLSAARKTDRTMQTWWHSNGQPALHKDTLDDAFDAINYFNFFIRCAREGNITGHAPERPDADMPHIGLI